MRLNEVQKNKEYIITNIDQADEYFNTRASQLGLREGVSVALAGKAPLFRDPLLFKVDGSFVALTEDEANRFQVEERN